MILKNKTILLALGFLLEFIPMLSAQDEFIPQVSFGVQGGLNNSYVNFVPGQRDPEITYHSINRPMIGAYLCFMAEPYAGIQAELNFANRGWKEIYDSSYTYVRKVEYFEIPLLTHLRFGKKHFRYVFNLGPYLGIHRGYQESFEPFDAQSVLPEPDTNNYFGKRVDNLLELGFALDAGLGYQTSAGLIMIKGRFSHGVTSIFTEYPEGQFRSSPWRNFFIGVSYQYNINLRKKK